MKKITIKRQTRIEGHSDSSIKISDLSSEIFAKFTGDTYTFSTHNKKIKLKAMYTNEIIGVDDGV